MYLMKLNSRAQKYDVKILLVIDEANRVFRLFR